VLGSAGEARGPLALRTGRALADTERASGERAAGPRLGAGARRRLRERACVAGREERQREREQKDGAWEPARRRPGDGVEMQGQTLWLQRAMAARVARLATLGADGRPQLVPITFALLGETLYSAVDDKPKHSRRLQRIENARRRPEVGVLIDHYEEDWSRLWWLRLRGRARVLESGDEVARALEALCARYAQYRSAPPGPPVLAIDIVEWRGWSGSGPALP